MTVSNDRDKGFPPPPCPWCVHDKVRHDRSVTYSIEDMLREEGVDPDEYDDGVACECNNCGTLFVAHVDWFIGDNPKYLWCQREN